MHVSVTGVSALVEELITQCDPAEIFAVFASEPYSAFLDSSALDSPLGRFSIIAVAPQVTLKSRDKQIEIRRGSLVEMRRGDPFEALRRQIQGFSVQPAPGIPFVGGALGYFGYDLRHFVEVLPRQAENDLDLPEMYVGLYDLALVFDHHAGRLLSISTGYPETSESKRRRRAQERAAWLRDRVAAASATASNEPGPAVAGPEVAGFARGFTRAGYQAAVETVKEHIAKGDVYQVNLSQRFSVPLAVPPWTLYRRLRAVNPAPFSAYLNFDDVVVASSSPERFLRVEGRRIETRPIKGTRPRGKTREEDLALARELSSSPKDRAENLMIVDLLRNDLGRVAEIGSVRVPELFALERHPNVFHLVSTVTAMLGSKYDAVDLLRACWPGGSITGAPKIRAMEIIDQLEPTTRGVYCGSIGYLSFSGDMDTSIVIRTFVIAKGVAHFQVGGGIVADSDPTEEYQETLDKARGLIEALGGEKESDKWASI
jgi:para-aminobenzoate synthetase component I